MVSDSSTTESGHREVFVGTTLRVSNLVEVVYNQVRVTDGKVTDVRRDPLKLCTGDFISKSAVLSSLKSQLTTVSKQFGETL